MALVATALLLPISGHTQSLNEAVNSQLASNIITGRVCSELRSGSPGPPDFLTGELYAICTRGGPSGGNPASFSTGGGTATPTTLPSIVQQRLREAYSKGKKHETKPKPGGASADAVAEYANGLGLFISGEFQRLDRNVTRFEDGYGSTIGRMAAGADYQFTDRIMAGLAFDYYQQDGNFDSGGDFNNHSYGFLAFGSFRPFEEAFLQVTAGYARNEYDRTRFSTFTELNSDGSLNFKSTPGSQNADYNADEARVGALLGYDYHIRNITISPRAGVDFRQIDFGTYSDTGVTGLELTFHDESQTWLQTRVGAQALVALKTRFAVLVPHASVDWKHELSNDQRNVQVSFVGDMRAKRFTYQTESPDRDWFEINAGVSAALPHGLQSYVNYRVLVGHSFFDSHAGMIGLRYTF